MQRKLTAILSADVAGYSGLMELDEAGTLQRLKANRAAIFDPHVAANGGRQFKLMGDGALVEFGSVIAAVKCALAIQEATEKVATPASPIRYRIGINLGEVIVEGDDIYGEGVNVAARIQTLAPVGGVALSQVVRDQVEGKTPCTFDDLGEHTVKNITRPVRVYGVRAAAERREGEAPKMEGPRKLSVCVLPFANMSDDPQQEYFSDGISEDIITDLSKVSALSVISRNSAFMYKGKHVDLPKIARDLRVSHVLEGSVRKAGGRVRITAQLIDGATNDHVWAERFDRDLNDIFALQDEISEAIVKALKLKLLPEEKKAIETRGTDSVDAYNLYLMARQYYVTGNYGDPRREESIIRLCARAAEIDPGYAQAWALMALAQNWQRSLFGGTGDGGLGSAERALSIDDKVAEAHAVKAMILFEDGRRDEATPELAAALALDPKSYEVNRIAAHMTFRQERFAEAAKLYEEAGALMDTDFHSPGMQITCYGALGDAEALARAAHLALARIEKAVAQDQSNGAAMGWGSVALAALGQKERAKEWMHRALLVDPSNMNMRYNFACAAASNLKEPDVALELIEPFLATATIDFLNHAKVDPDLNGVREDPRFKTMIAAAEKRLGQPPSS
ncbi:MAG: adenylate/guanylate cyclase domain-containing protein [Alphaproteobacteria bacterium]|nr:adenylate/guanylate cyclase domain-containing protein [Alphaproteobacteria bacterium]